MAETMKKTRHRILAVAVILLLLVGCGPLPPTDTGTPGTPEAPADPVPTWATDWVLHRGFATGNHGEDLIWSASLPPAMFGANYGTYWYTSGYDVQVGLGETSVGRIPGLLDDSGRLDHDAIAAYNPGGMDLQQVGVEVPVSLSASFPDDTDVFAVCYNGCEPIKITGTAAAKVFFLTLVYHDAPVLISFTVMTSSPYYPQSLGDVAMWLRAYNLTVEPTPAAAPGTWDAGLRNSAMQTGVAAVRAYTTGNQAVLDALVWNKTAIPVHPAPVTVYGPDSPQAPSVGTELSAVFTIVIVPTSAEGDGRYWVVLGRNDEDSPWLVQDIYEPWMGL